MKHITTLTFAFFIFLLADGLHAQPGEDTKWALGWSGNAFVSPLLTENTSAHSPHKEGGGMTIWGEYYFPGRWNATVGYYQTEVGYGYADRSMQGIQLGIKKYFVNPDFILQPYLSIAPRINWNACRDWEEYGHYRNGQLLLEGRAEYRNPRLTCHVGAGLEIYIFSSVAFVAEYNLGMGIAGKTYIEEYNARSQMVTMRDRGFYHNVSLGLKVTFPFRFTYDDGITLVDSILDLLLYW